MQANEPRPPYVTFEVRAEEDRAETITQGRYVAKDVVYAIITPQGSKDRIERNAVEWLEQLTLEVRQERFNATWLASYKSKYEAFREGREMPLEGTPIITWPAVSPAQVRNLQDARILTVEDLAAANEETMSRLGMGARALKDRAVAYLQSVAGPGKLGEEVASLRQENADLKAANEKLVANFAAMQTQLDKLTNPVT